MEHLMSTNKSKYSMVVKMLQEELLAKDDQTMKIRSFQNCEENDMVDENHRENKVVA
jgi:hypothetical protein